MAAADQPIDYELTALRAQVAALETNLKRYDALVAAVPDLVVWLGRDGTYLDWRAEQFGTIPDDGRSPAGQNIKAVLRPHIANKVMSAVEFRDHQRRDADADLHR